MSRLLFLLAALPIAVSAADWSGRWTGFMETNGSRVRLFLSLKQSGESISGTVSTGEDSHPVAIEKAEVRGDDLSFEVRDNTQRPIAFRINLKSMTGEARVGGQVSRVGFPGAPARTGAAASAGVHHVGNGVSAPSLISKVEPEYSEEARSARYQGTVLLSLEVDADGHPDNIRVMRSLGLGLDEKAVEAVRKWRFKPGYKDGQPVRVVATIEVNFRLGPQ